MQISRRYFLKNGAIAMLGMASGLALMLYVKFQTPIAFTWYVLIGTSATFLAGLAASFVWKEIPDRAKA